MATGEDLFKLLAVPGELTAACLSRTFTRERKSLVRRLIVEHVTEEGGRVLFVVKRFAKGKRATVAVRYSEQSVASLRPYTSCLHVKTVISDDLPQLGPSPFSFVWKAHHTSGAEDGDTTSRIGESHSPFLCSRMRSMVLSYRLYCSLFDCLCLLHKVDLIFCILAIALDYADGKTDCPNPRRPHQPRP